jgi:hypothetical protein
MKKELRWTGPRLVALGARYSFRFCLDLHYKNVFCFLGHLTHHIYVMRSWRKMAAAVICVLLNFCDTYSLLLNMHRCLTNIFILPYHFFNPQELHTV